MLPNLQFAEMKIKLLTESVVVLMMGELDVKLVVVGIFVVALLVVVTVGCIVVADVMVVMCPVVVEVTVDVKGFIDVVASSVDVSFSVVVGL